MKYLILLLTTACLSIASMLPTDKTTLSGKITDETGEPLIAAAVLVKTNKTMIAGASTDVDGNYKLELPAGKYTVEVAYTGYETLRVTDFIVEAEQDNHFSAQLKSSTTLEEVEIVAYRVPLVRDEIASGAVYDSGDIRPMSKAEPKKSAPTARAKADKAPAVDDAPKPVTPEIAVEHLSITKEKAPVLSDGLVKDLAPDDRGPELYPGKPSQPAPKAGLLTAGEWNDLQNWNNHWKDMLADGEIDAFQNTYGFFPQKRFTLLLSNQSDIPLVDIPVVLQDRSGNTLWEARTDNTGRAELWADLFEAKGAIEQVQAYAWVNGQKKELGALHAYEKGINRRRLSLECGASQNVDIVWVVDATGSMGDELEYLKSEALDVIGRVKSNNPTLNIRMGSVFYRDKGDEYLVKSSGLSNDIEKTVEYIGKQSAAGGGDYPEAVHSALSEAIYNQKWSPDAVSRICFLVLDASPHQDPEILADIRNTIREAAKLGIRVVPVSGSGIQKDTEFLMKFLGLATNGSYVFLTDHSGIGGKHIEPTTDEYKVELLNDLLVRLITEYTTVQDCSGKTAIRFDDPQQIQNPNTQQALYYPNPCSTQFNLDLPFEASKITLYDAEGKAVRQIDDRTPGVHTVIVSDLPPGFYSLRIWKEGQSQSGKILIVRS